MKTKVLIALFAAATLVTGCEEKKETGADKKDDKKDKKEDKKDKEDKKGEGEGELAGLPQVCQDYLKEFDACMKKVGENKDMPAEAKKALEDSGKMQKDAYKMATDEATKKALEPGCKAALDAMKANPSCK